MGTSFKAIHPWSSGPAPLADEEQPVLPDVRRHRPTICGQ
jgi:hypothetical protein